MDRLTSNELTESHVPHRKTPINDRLYARIRDTDATEDNSEIVTDQRSTGGLSEDGTSDDDPCAVTVAFSAKQVKPGTGAISLLESGRVSE